MAKGIPSGYHIIKSSMLKKQGKLHSPSVCVPLCLIVKSIQIRLNVLRGEKHAAFE